MSRNKREGAEFVKRGPYYALNEQASYSIPYANRKARKAVKRIWPDLKMSEIRSFWWPCIPQI